MDPSTLPAVAKEWAHVMKQNGEPVLTLSIRRPSFPETGKTSRMERYFAELARQWKLRWETVLYPRACQAKDEAVQAGTDFLPWQAVLDYTITLWHAPLLSLRLDIAESGRQPGRPLRICMGETWDCASGYPRTLRSFFPAGASRWRKELLDGLKNQAAQQLTSGESLLDPECARVMERTFDPDRYYLTTEGLAVFYPLCVLGAYAEGIPVFVLPAPAEITQRAVSADPERRSDGNSHSSVLMSDIPAPKRSPKAADSAPDFGR